MAPISGFSDANIPNIETATNFANPLIGADGVQVGVAPTTKVGFYGMYPSAQRTNAAQSNGTTTATSSAPFFGASLISTSGSSVTWQATQYNTTAMTGASAQSLIAEICNTLVGLGVWKGA